MSKPATAEDADIVMQLYDLRRESEMRKARHWFAGFWPQNADDVVAIINAFNTQENAWFRQVCGYWDMAASFVLRNALNEDLFVDSNGEMWFMFAKVYPFLKEIREKNKLPTFLTRVETVATRTQQGRERLDFMLERVQARRTAAAKASQAS
ncbi:MAG: hypothetical protein JO356_09585 [Acidobacteria bacterium]|nr:hypothetical protein [Acidobacteriota bacterium]